MVYQPEKEELANQLEKFSLSILDSSKAFGRWWKGFCTIFEQKTNSETGENYIPFTFNTQISRNKMVIDLQYDIMQQRTQMIEKIRYYMKAWIKRAHLKDIFDKNQMSRTKRMLERSNSAHECDRAIISCKRLAEGVQNIPGFVKNNFVLIDQRQVKSRSEEKMKEWFDLFGTILQDIANKGLSSIL